MHMPRSRSLALLALTITPALVHGAAQASTLTYEIPCTASPNAKTVSRSFPGFAFEQASFYNYSFTSAGEPNTFSQNLIKRASPAPIIRVGGTSGDRAHFNASQHNATNYPADRFGAHFQAPWLSIGPPFFDAFRNFDDIDAKYIFMVPWDRADVWRYNEEGFQNGLAWAKAGLDVIGLERLEALEIGNEPDRYASNVDDHYAARYRTYQSSLLRQLPALQGKRIFQALDIADGSAAQYDTESFFTGSDGGLGAIAPSIKQVAFHYYQGNGVDSVDELQDWVSHAKTVKQLDVFKNDMTFLRQRYNGHIRFVLDEVADNVGPGAVQGGLFNNFAMALWRVDFMLRAMSMGVDRVNWQQIFNERICMWLPVESQIAGPPRVLPDYYAMPFAADFIGQSDGTHVEEVEVSGDGDANVVTYAAYEGGKLARIALVNLKIWQSGSRPSPMVRLKVGDGSSRAVLRRLDAAGGALAKQGISWAGLQWTWENRGAPTGPEDTESLQVEGGVITLKVPASSAAMVTLV